MRPVFDNLAFVKHNDAVASPDGRDPVGDDKGGFPFNFPAERREDFLFGCRVYRRQGVVKNKDGGVY